MNDIEKLRVLLPHWMEHNEAHADEFRTWAKRAREAGETHLAEQVESAAARMDAANHDLAHALAHLGGPAGGSGHEHTAHDGTHTHHH